jgi:PAS domain S-box-containing protein
MKEMNILVVDDQEHKRGELIDGLIKHGLPEESIFDAGSGEEAIEMVLAKPDFFDIAVIDHILGEDKIDGIEATRRICTHEWDIFPIIFTNIPTDHPETIEFYREKAYEAGAYRYIYKGEAQEDIMKVKDFVLEIRHLRELRERVRRFYEAQRYAPSLLTQLDIMVSLIDRGYKVWYMNEANKKFQNLKELPRKACSKVFLKFTGPTPCKGCIVALTFQDGKSHERIYLHPDERSIQKIKWVYSWTQPMADENGSPILLEDGMPIAVLESSQDITDSPRLKTMPLKERMLHIARALNERPDGFDRVRIYETNPEGDVITLIAYAGYHQKIEPSRLQVRDFDALKNSISHLKRTGEGKFYHLPGNGDPICPGELLEKFIHWPLMKGERLLGLLSVSSVKDDRSCNEDSLDIARDYAVEALKALMSEDRGLEIPEIEKIALDIDNLIIQKGTPEGRLQTLVDEVYRLTDSDSVIVRYRQENAARLLPIGKGAYFEVAPREFRFSSRTIPPVRVIISGREEIDGHAKKDREMVKFLQTLPQEAAEEFSKLASYCYQPLLFQNRCIGSLALYKRVRNHYNEKSIAITRIIADRMALAVHDYLVNIDRMIKDYAVESSINAIVFFTLNGNVNYVNPSFLKLLRYDSHQEIFGKQLSEFFADKEEASAILECLNKGDGWDGALVGRRKDSSTFDAQLYASLVRDRTGKAIGAMGSFIDISERKQLEKVQESIYLISEAASSVQNLEDLYKNIHEIIKSLIPATNFYIALWDEQNDIISFPYFIDQKDPQPGPRKRGKGMTEYILKLGEPVLAPKGVYMDLKKKGVIEIIGTPSIDWLGVPLKTAANKTIGILAVQTYEEGLRYTEKDKDILVFVSEQTAMAIERKQREEQIKASLHEKEVLLKEIHHRVKNNLAIINELLELQAGFFKEQEHLDLFESSKNRIRAMALVHETLHKSDDITRIDSAVYIDNLVNHLTLAYGGGGKNIDLKSRIDTIPMSIDTAIPCGLIINELVTNAYKHAFPENRQGEIAVGLSADENNRVSLTVSDNGIGLPHDLDISKSSSIGLQLVDILTRQLDADLSIERNGGTRFRITFAEQTSTTPSGKESR